MIHTTPTTHFLVVLSLMVTTALTTSPTCALNRTPCPTPTWPIEWNLTRSTLCQPGNTNGYFQPPPSQPWGLVSLDWSVAQNIWLSADKKNSTCEATSVHGCQLLKASGTATRCFIYHNSELALEWLESQRAVMYNPKTANYFLQYTNDTIFNHPADVGDQYFWNYTNEEAAAYYVNSIVESLSDPAVDGTLTDDVKGVPEEHPEVITTLNMTTTQVAALQFATQATNQVLIDTLVKYGKYNWQAFGNEDDVGNGPTSANCASWMRTYCQASYQNYPMTMELDTANKNQTVAAFFVTRPPYGWLGFGWESDQRNWDPIFLLQAGEPKGLCKESPSGVFGRQWTNGVASLNCNTWTADLPFPSLY